MTRQRPAHRRVRLSGTTPRLDRRGLLASTAFAAMVGTGLFSFATPVMGQTPTGGVVVGGSATITQNSSTQLTVNQTTARGVIDWQSFSIGAGARVDFIQPGASSVTLNRVIGPDPSLINGQLNANGQIILINPSGVTFGGGAQVNVHSLIAATANVGNVQTFMAGGTVAFDRASANPDAAVINQGTITVKEGGLVGLVGPNAANHGVINARLGRVTIGGAETLTVDLAGDGLLGLQIGPATKVATKATNTGTINAPGGSVSITAATARGVVDSITNVQGMVKATTVSIEGGAVVFGGDVDVSSATGKGGTVTASGTKVQVQSTARINANGASGGGTVLIGGGRQGAGPIANAQSTSVDKGAVITANATGHGSGGTVVVWADNTTVFAGTIEARGGAQGGDGGFVETSGKQTLSILTGASVSASAPLGQAGLWLLDPVNVTVDATLATSLASTLNGGTDAMVSTSDPGGDSGTITVASAVTWTTANKLTFNADAGIAINGAISGTSGTLALNAGLTTATGTITQSAAIAVNTLNVGTAGGDATLTNAANVVTNLGASGLGSGALSLVSVGGITVSGAVSASGGITLNTSGPLSLQAALDAGAGTVALTTTANPGAITQTSAGIVTAGTLTLNSKTNANLSTATNMVTNLGASSSAGVLSVRSGVATFSTTGAISASALTLNASVGALFIGSSISSSSSVTLTGVNGITQTGAISGGTLSLTTTNASAVLNGATNAVTSLTKAALGSGTLSLLDSGGLSITGLMTATGGIAISTSGVLNASSTINAGSATVSLTTTGSGNVIDVSGRLTAGTVNLTTTNANATIFNGFTNITSLGAVSLGTGTLNVLETVGLAVSGPVTAGGVTINTGGLLAINGTINVGAGTLSLITSDTGNAITQSAAITAGTLNITTGNANVTLDSVTNAVAAIGTVSIGTGAFALKTAAAAGFTVNSASITAKGGLAVTNTTGSITTSGALASASGAVSLSAAGALTLAAGITGVGVSLQSGDALALDQAIDGGAGTVSLSVTGAGNGITQTAAGTITAGTLTLSTNGGSVNLTTATNLVSGLGASTVDSLIMSTDVATFTVSGAVSAGRVILQNTGAMVINAPISVPDNPVRLSTTGGSASTITQGAAGVITSGFLDLITQGASATLDTATNVVTYLGTVSLGAGAFALKTDAAGGLTVGDYGIVANGGLAFTNTSGAITTTAALAATSGTVSLSAASSLNLGGTITGTGATLQSGDALSLGHSIDVGAGTVSLATTGSGKAITQSAGTITAGTLTLSTSDADATLDQTNAITNLGAASLGKGALSLIDAGGLTISGAVAASGGVTLTTSGALAINDALNGGAGSVSLTTTGSGNAITQNGAGVVTAGMLELTTTDGGASLDVATNAVSGLGSVSLGAGAFSLRNTGALALGDKGGVTARGGVTIRNGGAITLDGPIDSGSALSAVQALTGDIVQGGKGGITAGALLAVADAGMVDLRATGNAVSGAVAGAAATSFLFTNSLGVTVQAGTLAGNALVAGQTGITANTGNNAGGFAVDLAAAGGDILIQGAVSSDKGMIVYRRTAANTTGGIALDGAAANTLAGARLLVIDLSGATAASLYGATPGTALGGVFSAPTPASGTAGFALGSLTGGTVSLGSGFSGAGSTVYLGAISASFTGGSSVAAFGLLGVYGSSNKATLEGSVADIAATESTFSPLTRDFTGLASIGGPGAAALVRADAGNAALTFNGCQIGAGCGGSTSTSTSTSQSTAAYLQSQQFVGQFQGGPVFGPPQGGLDFDVDMGDGPGGAREKKK